MNTPPLSPTADLVIRGIAAFVGLVLIIVIAVMYIMRPNTDDDDGPGCFTIVVLLIALACFGTALAGPQAFATWLNT